MSFFFTLLILTSYTQPEPDLRIRQVYVNNLGVFDSQHEEFQWWGFRFLNRVHIKTNQKFIRNELLLKEGDLLIPDLMRESERNLRRYTFLTDVTLRSKRVNNEEVDLYVRTEDQWTTKPTLSWGQTKGSRTFDIGLEEENFLGLGKRVGFRYEKTPERDGFSTLYGDPRFLNTRMRLNVRYDHLSDGHRLNYGLTQPFYSQEARWSYGFDGLDSRRLSHYYYRTIDAAALETVERRGNFDLTHAWGERYQRNRFGVRLGYSHLFYPSVLILDEVAAQEDEIQRNLKPDERELFNTGILMVRDRQRFVKFYHLDNFGRTEDLPFGTHSGFSVVHSSDRNGHDFITTNLHGRYTIHRDANQYFVSAAGFLVRREGGEWNNWVTEFLLRYYNQNDSSFFGFFQKTKHTIAVNFATTMTADMDVPFQLSLGEDEGLRGYAFREFTGMNRALLNLEYRMMVPWQSRLVGISVVPFVDAGYVWNPDYHFGSSVGIGLRIGLKKYGRTRVLRIDYAYPLVERGRGASVSVSAGQSFEVL